MEEKCPRRKRWTHKKQNLQESRYTAVTAESSKNGLHLTPEGQISLKKLNSPSDSESTTTQEQPSCRVELQMYEEKVWLDSGEEQAALDLLANQREKRKLSE